MKKEESFGYGILIPFLAPVEIPAGLTHIDSDFCWCDPFVDLQEDGEARLIHREVTWN